MYYFTFGDYGQLYSGGYIKIKAKSLKEAQQKFIDRYGHRAFKEPRILNYAFDYTEEEFNRTGMTDLKCHAVLE